MVCCNRTTHLRAKQIPKIWHRKETLSYFARPISHLFLNKMQEKRRLTLGGGGRGAASPPVHCIFQRSVPGSPALDSILHIWYKTKANLCYPQTSSVYWGGYLLKIPSRSNRFKWYYIDPSTCTLLPRPNTAPKWIHSKLLFGFWLWTAALTQQKVTHASLFQAL